MVLLLASITMEAMDGDVMDELAKTLKITVWNSYYQCSFVQQRHRSSSAQPIDIWHAWLLARQ